MRPHDQGENVSALIVSVALRDRKAFDALYAQTSSKLFGACLRILKSRAEAEEALQEVFVKIWLKADRFAVTGQSPMSWLVAIARNQAIDRLRARREAAGGMDDAAMQVVDPAPGPEALVAAGQERSRIDGCLDELEPERAAAVQGAYLDGYSYVELAQRYDVPLNTLRTWLRRSLMRLRECLER